MTPGYKIVALNGKEVEEGLSLHPKSLVSVDEIYIPPRMTGYSVSPRGSDRSMVGLSRPSC
jgi:hypothetical protein